jgi:hypothetical protein
MIEVHCKHEEFESEVEVCRETDVAGTTIIGYSASLRIHCMQCGVPMRFLGVPVGSLVQGAAVSFDGSEARLALEPTPCQPHAG